MVFRPRTRFKINRKTRRCTKCGKLVRTMKRCKTCHKAVKN